MVQSAISQPVQTLLKNTLTRLENLKLIEVDPEARTPLREEVMALLGPQIWTQEELKEAARDLMSAHREELPEEAGDVEGDSWKVAQKMAKEKFGEHPMGRFFFQRPLKELTDSLMKHLMASTHVAEVFGSDEELRKTIVQEVQSQAQL